MAMMSSPPKAGLHTSPITPQSSQHSLKSILRVDSIPSVLGARKRGDDDFNEAEHPSKRKKSVQFDMSLNTTAQIAARSLEETKKAVRRALENHAKGDDEEYNEIKDIFANDRERYLAPVAGEEEDLLKPEELMLYVVALASCSPLLNKSCSTLINTLLKCSWLGRDSSFFKAYIQFLAALVSAHGSTLSPVLGMMVDWFKETKASAWKVPDFPEVDRETMEERLHRGLQHMLELFPAARRILCTLLYQRFPYAEEAKKVHLAYVDGLLRIREYAPELGPEIVELIVSQLVKLDVAMQLDLDDMDDELVSRVLSQLKRPAAYEDIDEDESDVESLATSDSDFDAEADRIERATNLVQTLDCVLDTLFGVYEPIFSHPDSPTARACLEDLLSDFTNMILPTRKSRHVQFLLFHFSQKSPALTDLFVGTVMNIAFASNRPTALRQAAVSYLGGFVARGSHVQRETVRSIATILCHRIEAFRQDNHSACRGPDVGRYQALYSYVQSVIYIFCFRWRDLVDSVPDIVDPDDPSSYLGKQIEWMPGLRQILQNIIYSPFNPLKVCTPPIVKEFAKLAHHLHLLYILPKIESNKSVRLSSFVSGRLTDGEPLRESGLDLFGESSLQLEAHFPFDPYQLPISQRWLQGDYVPWKSICPSGDGDEEDSDESDRGGDDEMEDEDAATDDEHEHD